MDSRAKKVGNGKEVVSVHSTAERRGVSYEFDDGSRIKTALSRSSLSLDIPPRITSAPILLQESPMMLPNTQAIISPTTGTFRARSLIHESSSNSVAPTSDGNVATNLSSSCRFNSHKNPICFQSFSGTKDQSSAPEVHYQTSSPTHFPMGYEYTTKFSTEASSKNNVCDSAADVKVPKATISAIPSHHMSQHKEHTHSENVRMHHIPEEQKGPNPPMVAGRSLEDGYHWRKYGQKQVKGSEHSRSYYKCTHPNCPMKKKVEQSLDGQITEIIYKGCHNHPKPQPSRRSAVESTTFSCNGMSGMGEGLASNVGVEDISVCRNVQAGCKDINRAAGSDWRSSTPGVNQHMGIFKSAGTENNHSSTSASQDYGEDGATPGSIPFEDDVDEDSESKKRAVRERRVVVQVESEFDLLDDGYRWRKYGQKVVKGNPNPRSYYKCTSNGCTVRRHVERASNDPKSVITTYEGKHNHELPVARKSSHGSSSGGNFASAAGAGAQSALTLQRNCNVSRPEALLHDLGPHFDIKPEFISSDEYIRPSMLGNFANDMKFGPSSHIQHQLQFPSIQIITNHYPAFGLDSNNVEPYQPGSVAPMMATSFPTSLPSGLVVPANLGTPGFDFNGNGNLIGQFEPYFMEQQLQENDVRFLHPKEELKDDIGDANVSSSSNIYHRILGNFPP